MCTVVDMAAELTPLEIRVAGSVRAELARAGLTRNTELASIMKMHVEGIRRRHRHDLPWTVAELGRLAEHLGIDPVRFFTPE